MASPQRQRHQQGVVSYTCQGAFPQKTDFLGQLPREKAETMKSFTQSAIAAKSIDEFISDGSFIENLKSLLIYLALIIYVAKAKNISSLFDKLSKYTRQQPLSSVQDKPVNKRRSVLESVQDKPIHQRQRTLVSTQVSSQDTLSECNTVSVKSEEEIVQVKKVSFKPPAKKVTPITVENYSDKSFVVRGDTFGAKDKLAELGGKWNKFLTDKSTETKFGGWVFSNNKRVIVEEFLNPNKI